MSNKNNLISFRVDDELYHELEKRVEQMGMDSNSDYLRSILSANIRDGDTNQPVLDLFETDLRTLAYEDDNTPGVHTHITEQVWDTIEDDIDFRGINHQLMQKKGTTYVCGKGSSKSVAHWLSRALRAKDARSIAGSPLEITNYTLTQGDTLVIISRSGQTDSLRQLLDTYESELVQEDDDVNSIAVTQPETPIAEKADFLIPIPDVEEKVENYATKSLIAQVAILQFFVVERDVDAEFTPDRATLDARFDALDEFLSEQFDQRSDSFGLSPTSSVFRAVEALKNQGDLSADPLFGSLNTQAGFGEEFELKFTEFAHLHSEHVHLADIRDRLLNLLFREKAYLVGVIPDLDHKSNTRWLELVFDNPDAIDKMLRKSPQDMELPIIAFSFAKSPAVHTIKERTKYREAGIIDLVNPLDTKESRDLIAFAGIYLLVYGVLTQLWAQDQELKSHVIDSVYDSDTNLNWGRL